MSSNKNQGEGNVEAARNYNEKTQEFVKDENVEQKARQAEPKDAAERAELERAEQAGKKRAKEHDPAVSRDYSKSD